MILSLFKGFHPILKSCSAGRLLKVFLFKTIIWLKLTSKCRRLGRKGIVKFVIAQWASFKNIKSLLRGKSLGFICVPEASKYLNFGYSTGANDTEQVNSNPCKTENIRRCCKIS